MLSSLIIATPTNQARAVTPSVEEVAVDALNSDGLGEAGAKAASAPAPAIIPDGTGAGTVTPVTPTAQVVNTSATVQATSTGQPTGPANAGQPASTGHATQTKDGVPITSISAAVPVPSENPSVVGVTFRALGGGHIEVRTKSGDSWSDWQRLGEELGEPGEKTPGTWPYTVAGVSHVQVRVLGGTDVGATLVVIDPKRAPHDPIAVRHNQPLPPVLGPAGSAGSGSAGSGSGKSPRSVPGLGAASGSAGASPVQPGAGTDSSAGTSVPSTAAGAGGVAGATTSAKLDLPDDAVLAHNVSVKQAVGKPHIATRKEWGADEDMRDGKPQYASSVQAAIVHHTTGTNNYQPDDVPAILRGIYAFHTKTRGWADIGYNVLVDKFGRLWQGRAGDIDRAVVGAHAQGYNTGTFGISVMGNFEKQKANGSIIAAVSHAIAWKLGAIGAREKAYIGGRRFNVISGHRNVGCTCCPGSALYSQLNDIRDTVASYQAGTAQAGADQASGVGGSGGQAGGSGGQAGHVQVAKDFAAVWGRNKQALGGPTGEQKQLAHGSYQAFEHGAIHFSVASGAHATWGDIWVYWRNEGFERGHMGYPVGDPVVKGKRTEQDFQGAHVVFVAGQGVEEFAPRGGAGSGAGSNSGGISGGVNQSSAYVAQTQVATASDSTVGADSTGGNANRSAVNVGFIVGLPQNLYARPDSFAAQTMAGSSCG